jgi:hypothetical protein
LALRGPASDQEGAFSQNKGKRGIFASLALFVGLARPRQRSGRSLFAKRAAALGFPRAFEGAFDGGRAVYEEGLPIGRQKIGVGRLAVAPVDEQQRAPVPSPRMRGPASDQEGAFSQKGRRR